ncbi:MAG TPA: (Fe-S)-binding protein [Desulfomonilaceae bacterium]|nr:(Fe-S)-binding protein [Desulfomonilaceae bacterium]
MEESEKRKLLGLMADKLNRSVQMYLENCTHCGVCIDACHAFASTGDVRYTAVGRAQNIRRLFENYHKFTGKLAPWLNEAVELDERWMEKVYETAFTCTGCRRCMTYCPLGIDTQQIQAIAKAMLIGADMDPKPLTMRAKTSIQKGENLENTRDKIAKEVEKAREEMIERWPTKDGYDAIPLDVKGADVLFVSMAEKPSILSAATILNSAREKWTLSCFEAVNFGAFLGSPTMTEQIYQRIVSEAEQLGVKEMVICECGTAYRIMKHVIGKHSFNVITLVQLIDRYLREGRINLDKSRIEGRITYHDPCQIARNGGIYEEPRNCLKALTDDFVEMTPNRQANWCCGGGGGLVIAAEPEFRLMTARVKADQIKATSADVVATACEMCFAQLKDLNDEYELDARVTLVSDLVAEALVRE